MTHTKELARILRNRRVRQNKYRVPAGGMRRPVTTASMEAVVENKPQELRKLRSFFASSLLIPGNISTQAQIVLRALFDCFEKQGAVKEGLIGDMIWGFEQNTPPIPQNLTTDGLQELARHGYVKFQAKDGSFVGFESDKITGAWIRYQPKLLEMVYEDSAPQ